MQASVATSRYARRWARPGPWRTKVAPRVEVGVHQDERREDAGAEHEHGGQHARQELADDQHLAPHGGEEPVVQGALGELAADEPHEDPQAAEEDAEAHVVELDDPGEDQRLLVEVAAAVVERVRGDDERGGEGQEQQPHAAPEREGPAELQAHGLPGLAAARSAFITRPPSRSRSGTGRRRPRRRRPARAPRGRGLFSSTTRLSRRWKAAASRVRTSSPLPSAWSFTSTTCGSLRSPAARRCASSQRTQDLHRVLGDLAAHAVDLPFGDDVAVAQQHDVVGDAVDLVQDVARDDDVRALLARGPGRARATRRAPSGRGR